MSRTARAGAGTWKPTRTASRARAVILALASASLLFSLGCSGDKGTIDLLPSQEGSQLPPFCTDELLDGNETDLDCGGDCAGCGIGKICEEPADCAAGTTCVGTKCR